MLGIHKIPMSDNHVFNVSTLFHPRQNYLTAFKEMLDHCIRAQRDSEAISQYLHLRAMVSIAKRTIVGTSPTLAGFPLVFLQWKGLSSKQAPYY